MSKKTRLIKGERVMRYLMLAALVVAVASCSTTRDAKKEDVRQCVANLQDTPFKRVAFGFCSCLIDSLHGGVGHARFGEFTRLDLSMAEQAASYCMAKAHGMEGQ